MGMREGYTLPGNAATFRVTRTLLLLGVFLLGVAQIALLPPFEGYDETAHWSYIQQFADTLQVPVYGVDTLSADVEAYGGPLAGPGQPYRDALARPVPAEGAEPTRYAPGRQSNWQAQHPPLFYAVMALPYRALAGLDWRLNFFGLRLVSWSIAFAGFAWGAVLAQGVLRRRGIFGARLLVPLLWPLVFPEFFPEFARLTNDGLCLLLAACVWALLLRWLERGASWPRALALGVALGAGLWTKAFFLPVTAGVAALLFWLAWRQRRGGLMAVAVPALALLLAGGWYLAKWRLTGSVSGADDLIAMDRDGGLWAGLRAHFTVLALLRRLDGLLLGFAWAGTWSFVQPSRWWLLPVTLLPLLSGALYLARARRLDAAALSPLVLLLPVLAGLLYHLFAMLAAPELGFGTPGWYLHIFCGPLAVVLVLGWAGRAMWPLLGYGVALSAALAAMQATFFAGCLTRVDTAKVSLVEAGECLGALAPLRRVALPEVAAVAAVAAVLVLAFAAGRYAQEERIIGTIRR